MKITDMAKAKSTRFTIYVDGEYWYIIDAEILMNNHLRVGMEVDEDFLEEVKHQSQRRTARERAYYLLGYRDHSKKELYDKLAESACPQIAMEIVELVESQGLLNDEEYANKLARHCLGFKKWGRKKAMMEMTKRGIDKETAQIALEDCTVDTVANAKAIIEKKYYDCLDDYKGKQKLIAALSRLGYSYDEVKLAMQAYVEEMENDEYYE